MKVVISTPFPLPEKTAEKFGVTKKRAQRLGWLMDAIGEGLEVHELPAHPVSAHRDFKVSRRKLNGTRSKTRHA